MKLSGKVAFVTGAGQGIGRAIALHLAREGADVAVNDIEMAALKGAAAEIEALGRRSLALPADVSNSQQVTEMFERLSAAFGRLDILVNNAGIGPIHSILDCTEAEWNRVFDVNVKSVFLCSKTAAPYMIAQGGGKIINAASVAGIRASAYFAPYCASKAAVISLTQGLALELAPHGITVNAYAPGIIDTAMSAHTNQMLTGYLDLSTQEILQQRLARIPLGRLGTAEEVAALVGFLASEESGYITGQCIPVGGGLVMR